MDIREVEQQLTNLVATDKRTWVEFYKLLKEVEEQRLYEEKGFKSFTNWVKKFATNNKIHESVIWSRKKAGKVYEKYQQRQAEKGIEVAPIEELDVSADSLVLVEKIANKDSELGAEMIEKVLDNQLTRADLRRTYKLLRDANAKEETNDNPSTEEAAGEPVEVKISDAKMTAILTNKLMSGDDLWVCRFGMELGMEQPNLHREVGKMSTQKCKAVAEFPVYTSTSRKSRRIDVLTVENYFSEEGTLHLHGIEVKVSEGDLKRDKKYSEYAEFVDFLWIAIPMDLLEVALVEVPDTYGILAFKDFSEDYKNEGHGNFRVERLATRLNPLMREEALTTLILRTI